jgi:hypothetical protein
MNKQIVSIAELIPLISEKVDAGGKITIRVKGTSMTPFLIDAITDVTLVKPMTPLQRLDVILYQASKGNYALHRIVRVTADYLVICGDALTQNEYIPVASVIARVYSFSTEGKLTSCVNKKYLSRVRLWLFFRPIRRILLGLNHLLTRRKTNG